MASRNARRLAVRALACIALIVGTLGWAGGTASAATGNRDFVFTLTNSTSGNEVLAFVRAQNGSLKPAGSFSTGGLGTSAGLGNQGGLVLSDDAKRLFAINAGSDQISAFKVGPRRLRLTDTVPSGGDQPISLTLHGDLLYALNAGSPANITGFTVASNGSLTAVPNSTRPLSQSAPGPAQVEFSPDGGVIVVTEKDTNLIDTYTVAGDGLATGPTTHPSNGPTPFGFAFGPSGRLFVSEAFGGAAGASATSSYKVSGAGGVSVISGSVPTTETAACWLVVTEDEQFAYVTNTGSGSVSGYYIGSDGTLTLLDPDGVTGVTGAGPIDAALTRGSGYLFTLDSGSHSISAFRVNGDGSLTPAAGASGLPAGATGLAAT
jgi:6-phosphogluconolactonase